MNIHIVVNPVEGGWSPQSSRLGGTEDCVVQWAKGLYLKGHNVKVYHNGDHGNYDGVIYLERSAYADYSGQDVTLNVNYPDLPISGRTAYWTTLVQNYGRDLSKFDKILAISDWQRRHTDLADYPVETIEILEPGYDPARIYPEDKIPKTVLYASSPDRGLQNLIPVWPEVVKVHPDAQLIVTYNGHIDTPNTICLGNVSQDEMDELFRTSDIWVHPAVGGELYCINAVKAQVAGCVPIYYPIMALAQTVKVGQRSSNQHLLEDLIMILGDDKYKTKIRQQAIRQSFPTWESTTDKLEQILYNIVKE